MPGPNHLVINTDESKERMAMRKQLKIAERVPSYNKQLAEIGHELNNFLTVIQTNIELIDRYIAAKEYGRAECKIKDVINGLNSINRFVEGLMEPGQHKCSKTRNNVGQIVSRIIRFLKPQKKFNGIIIRSQIDNNLPDVYVNSSQIEQIILNLMSNAADAVHESGDSSGLITVKVCYNKRLGSIEISVADSGCGITNENKNRMFKERFTTKNSGHGLGLVACRGLIENHNGRFQIESEIGSGTTITVSVPIC
ncbi:MAG: GHKL domain-containing protein [candidate division Zixibacteria bacterium]|nr:GHKL domain-containing protein [candidate division Zixibacteria bacterium]